MSTPPDFPGPHREPKRKTDKYPSTPLEADLGSAVGRPANYWEGKAAEGTGSLAALARQARLKRKAQVRAETAQFPEPFPDNPALVAAGYVPVSARLSKDGQQLTVTYRPPSSLSASPVKTAPPPTE